MNLNLLAGLASQKLYQHGLQEWTFGFGNFGRRLGVCKYRINRIEIAEYYAANNPIEEVMDTLMHEIAHALTPGHKHNSVWRAMAVQLGARPKSCAISEVAVKPGEWQAKCDCGKVYHKYKNAPGLEQRRFTCPACQMPMWFEWVGDPAMKPKSIEPWRAICACGPDIHKKSKKPNRIYSCRKCRTRLEWFKPTLIAS